MKLLFLHCSYPYICRKIRKDLKTTNLMMKKYLITNCLGGDLKKLKRIFFIENVV